VINTNDETGVVYITYLVTLRFIRAW